MSPSPDVASPPSPRQRVRLQALRTLARLAPRPVRAPLAERPRILVIRPDHIGDVLLATPALTLLRRAFPESEIAALVGPWSREVASRCPALDTVLTCAFPGFTRRSVAWPGQPYLELRRARELRKHGFDVAVIARPDHWWGAVLAAAAGIPHRVGFNVPECAPYLTEAIDAPSGAHVGEHNLAVAARVCELAGVEIPPLDPQPSFEILPAEHEEARAEIRAAALVGDGPLVVLHPGAGTELKLWPPERWARVLDLLQERLAARTLIVSTAAEANLVQDIRSSAARQHAAVETDRGLGYLAALLGQADVVLGSDSGPLHLAAAVGTPTVRLYGPTDPARFGPWPPGEPHVGLRALTPCSPCHYVAAPPCGALRHPWCLMEHTPDEVVASAQWVLAQRAR